MNIGAKDIHAHEALRGNQCWTSKSWHTLTKDLLEFEVVVSGLGGTDW